MNTTLECSKRQGQWSQSPCRRQPVTQWAPENHWGRDSDKQATLYNLLCNFHAGHRKRRSYRNEVRALTEADIARLLPLQAEKDEQARVEAEEKAKAAAIARAERRREEWAAQSTQYEHSLGPRESRYNDQKNPAFDGYVFPEGFTTEQASQRADYRFVEVSARLGFAWHDDASKYPYTVQMTSAKGLTPNEARAVAALLTEAADKAEELNSSRRPA